MNNIKKIVIWGHKLHTHTHSYIHYGFFKAFQHLGYETLWLDDNDNVENIDFCKCLFLTEGQVDKNIPLIKDSYYVLHNCNLEKYNIISENNKMILQVYTHDVINKHKAELINKEHYTYYKNNCLFMPWATDLLPFEIEKNIEFVKNNLIENKNIISMIGCGVEAWEKVKEFCISNKIQYLQKGGFGFSHHISPKDNIYIIQKSLLAPAVQSTWQVENGYIPCRIFKNISYGKMGLTNNKTVYDLFYKKILYDNDINNLLKKGLIFENANNNLKKTMLLPLMEYIRNDHTYLNRIKLIFWFLENKIIK